jgi:hypothetical protein
VPAEAQRLQRRLQRRDRLVIATILAATGITIAGALSLRGETSHPQSTQCISYDDAGVMGGGTWHLCGNAALKFCMRPPTSRTAVLCTKLGARSGSREPNGSRDP